MLNQGLFTGAVTAGVWGRGVLETAFDTQQFLLDEIGKVDNTWMGQAVWGIKEYLPSWAFTPTGKAIFNLTGFAGSLGLGVGKTLFNASYCSFSGGEECWDDVGADLSDAFSKASGMYAKDILTDLLVLAFSATGYGLAVQLGVGFIANIVGSIVEDYWNGEDIDMQEIGEKSFISTVTSSVVKNSIKWTHILEFLPKPLSTAIIITIGKIVSKEVFNQFFGDNEVLEQVVGDYDIYMDDKNSNVESNKVNNLIDDEVLKPTKLIIQEGLYMEVPSSTSIIENSEVTSTYVILESILTDDTELIH